MIKQGLDITHAIQVTMSLTDEDTKQREVRGLLEACKTHNLKEGLILIHDQEDEFEQDDVKIKVLPVWKWLLVENQSQMVHPSTFFYTKYAMSK